VSTPPDPASLKSSENESTSQTNLDSAQELYEKAKSRFDEENLDEKTAILIVTLADDALLLFGPTNQEKKVELKLLKKKAESVLPPETLEELRKRAESRTLKELYPRRQSRQRVVLRIVSLILIVGMIFGIYKMLTGELGWLSNTDQKQRPIPSPGTLPTSSPISSPAHSPPGAQTPGRSSAVVSSPEPVRLSADERAMKLMQEGETLMNAGKPVEAIPKFKSALEINGISLDLQSKLQELLLRAETRANVKKAGDD
jgi:hypothetical protein